MIGPNPRYRPNFAATALICAGTGILSVCTLDPQPAGAMDAVQRFAIEQSRPAAPAEPCNDDWTRLHWWYSAPGMSCELFREQLLGCADAYGAGPLAIEVRAICMAWVALGSDSPKRYAYSLDARMLVARAAWKRHHVAPFDERDIERAAQLVRVLHGIPSLKRDPARVVSRLRRARRRMADSVSPTKANRAAAAHAARRTRWDP